MQLLCKCTMLIWWHIFFDSLWMPLICNCVYLCKLCQVLIHLSYVMKQWGVVWFKHVHLIHVTMSWLQQSLCDQLMWTPDFDKCHCVLIITKSLWSPYHLFWSYCSGSFLILFLLFEFWLAFLTIAACFIFSWLISVCIFWLLHCLLWYVFYLYSYICLNAHDWFSKAKQSMSLLSFSSVCGQLALDISFLWYFCWYWGGPHVSFCPADYASGLCLLYFAISTLVVIWFMPHHGPPSSWCTATIDLVGRKWMFWWVWTSLLVWGCLVINIEWFLS